MGWFFKGLPSGKRVTPIYPMETPNGVRSTVGGRFIPSGLLLAQDFTMSQLARRENAPHRAAFVTSLSRWYIRRLLGNLPPFHPCLRRGGPVLPLAGLRHPTDISPRNQGTASFFCLPVSVSGTDLTCGFAGAGLPGNFPARPRFTGVHPLRYRDPHQRRSGGTSGGRHTQHIRNLWRPYRWLEGRMGERPILLLESKRPCRFRR